MACVCLSVCHVPGSNSRMERPSKPKIGRMEAHHTSNPWTWGQKVKATRPFNVVTDNSPYASRSIIIFLKLVCWLYLDISCRSKFFSEMVCIFNRHHSENVYRWEISWTDSHWGGFLWPQLWGDIWAISWCICYWSSCRRFIYSQHSSGVHQLLYQ